MQILNTLATLQNMCHCMWWLETWKEKCRTQKSCSSCSGRDWLFLLNVVAHTKKSQKQEVWEWEEKSSRAKRIRHEITLTSSELKLSIIIVLELLFFLSCFQFSSLFFSIRSLSVHFASILVSCCCWLFGCCIHHSRPRSKGREKNDRAMWIQEFFPLFCPF